MSSIPDEYHDLLTEKRTFATLATLLPNGLPHLSIVWIDYDPEEGRILVNTERERRKEKNVRGDSRVGVLAPDPDSPYRWVSVAGEVDEVTTEGAREHIDELARRYTDHDSYQNPIENDRVIFRIRPDHVYTFSPES